MSTRKEKDTIEGKRMRLRKAVSHIMTGASPRLATEALVHRSHQFAIAYLKHKASHGRLRPELFGLTLEDLALDCVAELFCRDDAGRFSQIVDYFGAAGWEEKDEAAIHIALRRLVFSKVNEELFRRYRNHDPALSRLIRNVKNAVKDLSGWSLVRRGHALWMMRDDATEDHERPTLPPEILEAHLVPAVRASTAMPDIVAAFTALVKGHRTYRAAYPVTPFAQAVQRALERLAHAPDDAQDEDLFRAEEVDRVIMQAVRETRRHMHSTYVGHGKLDAETFGTYMQITRDILQNQYNAQGSRRRTYYDVCHHHLPSVSKDDYRTVHRHVIEYLVKQARETMIDYLREELKAPSE